jgi:aminoglycoside phosphotransferase (APT) family kinase protein
VLVHERAVASSVDELLAGATSRQVMAHPDGKSGVLFERVVIDGERFVVKHLHPDDDWIMRASGDVRCRPLLVWQSGLLDRMPARVDHAVVGAAAGLGRCGWGSAIMMRDVTEWLIPEGDALVTEEQEANLLDHMAQLHAAFWGWEDTVGLAPLSSRYTYFSSRLNEVEDGLRSGAAVPEIARDGWSRLPDAAPSIADDILELRDAPWPVIAALAELPQTLVHGDWKMGNLGAGPDGRTILLDWATPGESPCVSELAWWLALNTKRLPSGKDANIELYRAALERHGIDTSPWWDRALDLALLGALVQFGWEKAFEPGPELDWWVDRATAGLKRL